LSALEAVTLAVLEDRSRRKPGGTSAAYRGDIDEAHTILVS